MNLVLEAIPVPLQDDGHGGLRVGKTRVSFDSVWHLYQQAASPAEIVQAFDTLNPADVYAVLAWALRHPEVVDVYLRRREEEAAELRRKLEEAGITRSPAESTQLKEKLMMRWNEQQRQRASNVNTAGSEHAVVLERDEDERRRARGRPRGSAPWGANWPGRE